MHVALMPDIPDQLVARDVVHFVQGQCQLDHAQRRREVAAGLSDAFRQVDANLLCQRAQAVRREMLDVFGAVNFVEQGGLAVHADTSF